MRPHFVRVTPVLVVAAFTLAACSNSNPTGFDTLAAARSSFQQSVSALPFAQATVHTLPALDGYTAVSMNDFDEVVGSKGANTPFRWSRWTGLKHLDTQGAAFAAALSVNDIGEVAGYVGGSGTLHAAVWLPNGKLKLLRAPADSATNPASVDCIAEGINIRSEVVGRCGLNFIIRTPVIFKWRAAADTTPQNLVFDGDLTSISNDGWIGGASDQSDINQGAFVISPTFELFNLRSASGMLALQAGVFAVTSHGWSAGTDRGSGGCSQAAAWLGSAQQDFPETLLGTCGQASGLTDDWFVTGTGTDAAQDDTSAFAFVWSPDHGLQRLPGVTAGGTSGAAAINARHHILGSITSGGVSHNVIWALSPRLRENLAVGGR
jgi:hypothetical protein